ncbi:MAG: hypothetical protein JRN08_03775 [Nitrososphaerota archaeon]|nr:hypothetical protein [Nitrososphaerota archaeon]
MISFAVIVGSLALATFVPVYASLYLLPALKVRERYLAAFGVGLAFWFFYDTMGEAASLGENRSLYPFYLFGGFPHLMLIGAFVAGVAVLAFFDQASVPVPGRTPSRNAAFLIPAAVALVMGVHGLGEGWSAVSAVASAPSTGSYLQTLIQAFVTFPALVSYPIHKFLEAGIVAILYAVYLKGGPGSGRWWEVPLLGLLFAGPSAVGAALGYFYSFDTTYLFAFGVTAALYATVRLVEPIGSGVEGKGRVPAHYGPEVFGFLALGILLLYFAALLH